MSAVLLYNFGLIAGSALLIHHGWSKWTFAVAVLCFASTKECSKCKQQSLAAEAFGYVVRASKTKSAEIQE